jgi:hypothetical protein
MGFGWFIRREGKVRVAPWGSQNTRGRPVAQEIANILAFWAAVIVAWARGQCHVGNAKELRSLAFVHHCAVFISKPTAGKAIFLSW